MKKIIYVLILPLVVVSGLVFANRENKHEDPKKTAPKPLSAAEREAEREKWEATPGGIHFKIWEASPAGKKVLSDAEKVSKQIWAFSKMEAVVTSLSLPPESRLGFGVMVSINGEDYILTFQTEKSQLEALQSLKVNDKITLKARNVAYAPKYSYAIVSAEYAELDGKVIFKRILSKDGC